MSVRLTPTPPLPSRSIDSRPSRHASIPRPTPQRRASTRSSSRPRTPRNECNMEERVPGIDFEGYRKKLADLDSTAYKKWTKSTEGKAFIEKYQEEEKKRKHDRTRRHCAAVEFNQLPALRIGRSYSAPSQLGPPAPLREFREEVRRRLSPILGTPALTPEQDTPDESVIFEEEEHTARRLEEVGRQLAFGKASLAEYRKKNFDKMLDKHRHDLKCDIDMLHHRLIDSYDIILESGTSSIKNEHDGVRSYCERADKRILTGARRAYELDRLLLTEHYFEENVESLRQNEKDEKNLLGSLHRATEKMMSFATADQYTHTCDGRPDTDCEGCYAHGEHLYRGCKLHDEVMKLGLYEARAETNEALSAWKADYYFAAFACKIVELRSPDLYSVEIAEARSYRLRLTLLLFVKLHAGFNEHRPRGLSEAAHIYREVFKRYNPTQGERTSASEKEVKEWYDKFQEFRSNKPMQDYDYGRLAHPDRHLEPPEKPQVHQGPSPKQPLPLTRKALAQVNQALAQQSPSLSARSQIHADDHHTEDQAAFYRSVDQTSKAQAEFYRRNRHDSAPSRLSSRPVSPHSPPPKQEAGGGLVSRGKAAFIRRFRPTRERSPSPSGSSSRNSAASHHTPDHSPHSSPRLRPRDLSPLDIPPPPRETFRDSAYGSPEGWSPSRAQTSRDGPAPRHPEFNFETSRGRSPTPSPEVRRRDFAVDPRVTAYSPARRPRGRSASVHRTWSGDV